MRQCNNKFCTQRAGGPGSLDNMLGNLNADMTKQGIMTVPKGSCAACQKPIVGLVRTLFLSMFLNMSTFPDLGFNVSNGY